MQHVLFVLGLVLLVGVELLRWLADAPAETCTGLTAIAWLMIGGPPVLTRVAGKVNERGFAAHRMLVAVAGAGFVLFLGWLSAGCGSRQVTAAPGDPPPFFDVRRGPPCVMSMHTGDGELHGRIRHPTKPCRVIIDEDEVPPKAPGTGPGEPPLTGDVS